MDLYAPAPRALPLAADRALRSGAARARVLPPSGCSGARDRFRTRVWRSDLAGIREPGRPGAGLRQGRRLCRASSTRLQATRHRFPHAGPRRNPPSLRFTRIACPSRTRWAHNRGSATVRRLEVKPSVTPRCSPARRVRSRASCGRRRARALVAAVESFHRPTPQSERLGARSRENLAGWGDSAEAFVKLPPYHAPEDQARAGHGRPLHRS
jgi:hypothetical protein